MTSRDQWIPGEIGRTWSGHRLVIDVALADPVEVLRAQRARFTQRLRRLPTHAWGAPTRCELWDVADVVAHLADGNRRARPTWPEPKTPRRPHPPGPAR
jgi:Mycothiol maleylpyruvate isomerase N-terminal domain